MAQNILVRELDRNERLQTANAKTGDMLPDGSVLLWRQDMDRMGLNALRNWLEHTVIDESAVVSVADGPDVHRGPDEEFVG